MTAGWIDEWMDVRMYKRYSVMGIHGISNE